MIYLYKKVDKKKNNTFGFTEITGVKDLNKPFLLCLSGNDNYDKSVFGVMRAGVQAARGYTTKEMAAGFILNSLPIDFLGISFEKDKKYSNNYDEFAERLLYPFLVKEGKSVKNVLKQARKINILTFDKGAFVYRNVEVKLKTLLIKNGYSKEDTIDILTQISVVALATNADLDEVRATCTIINDVNDVEIASVLGDQYRRVLERSNANFMYLPNGDFNCLYYSFLGSGQHNINAYLSDTCVAKPIICALVSNSLENSLINEASKELVGINMDVSLKVLYYYAIEGCPTEQLLGILDSRLSYCGCPKYTVNEAHFRKQLDDSYKLLRRTRSIIEKEKEDESKKNQRLNNLIKCIRKYSSDVSYYQIITEAGFWKDSLDVFKEESDKEVRKKYDKIPKTVKKEIEKETKKKTTKATTKKSTSKKTTTKKKDKEASE